MGGLDIKIRTKPCKWCERQLKQHRWWRPKRYCNRWHAFRYGVTKTIARVIEEL
ncbi:hypothetical protein [Streptomyces sp. NPDC090029]|uniref:hypothetical protein n=1 Tax=Streptomyces sp. NPDC090029 TaxID=3365924 RepID=UPI003813F936